MSGDWTFRDCVALLGPELAPWRCASLTVARGRIVEIDRVQPVRHLDTGAYVVMPALCNGHTHMGDSCLPDGATGLTLEEAFFRPDGYKYRALRRLGDGVRPHLEAHLAYMARCGIVAHCDFRESGLEGARLLRDAAAATGVDAVILSQFAEPPFDAEALATDRADLSPADRAALEAALAVADGFSESTMNDLTSPAWATVRALTDRLGKLRAIHCLENAGYRDLSRTRTGQGDLARALALFDPHLVVHLTVADPDEIALLAASGKTAVLNPRANAHLGLPLPPVAALLRAGVNLMLGTDNGMLNSPNLFPELDFTFRLAKSQCGNAVDPDPAAILRMVTSNAGAVLGERFPGQLEVGRPAHLCVLDLHAGHLRHTRHLLATILTRVTPAEVVLTLRAGRPLHRAPTFPPAS